MARGVQASNALSKRSASQNSYSKLCITRTAGDQRKMFELYGISSWTMFVLNGETEGKSA